MGLPPPAVRHSELPLAVCTPCQPFNAQRKHGIGSHDGAVRLGEFGRLVVAILPTFVLVENVPGIVRGRASARFVDSAGCSPAITTSALPGPRMHSRAELSGSAADACCSRHETAFCRYSLPGAAPLGNRSGPCACPSPASQPIPAGSPAHGPLLMPPDRNVPFGPICRDSLRPAIDRCRHSHSGWGAQLPQARSARCRGAT